MFLTECDTRSHYALQEWIPGPRQLSCSTLDENWAFRVYSMLMINVRLWCSDLQTKSDSWPLSRLESDNRNTFLSKKTKTTHTWKQICAHQIWTTFLDGLKWDSILNFQTFGHWSLKYIWLIADLCQLTACHIATLWACRLDKALCHYHLCCNQLNQCWYVSDVRINSLSIDAIWEENWICLQSEQSHSTQGSSTGGLGPL